MKTILLLIVAASVLASTGCIFVGHRDHPDDRDHPASHDPNPHPPGVDHGEYPGDIDHQRP
jgi:hypothetical protein